MVRFLICLFTLLLSFNLNAIELISGELDSLRNESKIVVSLDCSECIYCIYDKNIEFEYFLAKAPRDEDWEKIALKYFVENFNEETYDVGLIGVIEDRTKKARYELIIKPMRIFSNGDIKAMAIIKNIHHNKIIAVLNFSAEGDNDDKIVLRDPMKEAGEDFGNLFYRVLRGKKITARSNISTEYYDEIYN